jgi:hypothetical protein
MRISNLVQALVLVQTLGAIAGCGGGGGGGAGGNPVIDPIADPQLEAVDAMFPAPTSGPLDTVYECRRNNSNLLYYLYLRPDGALDWRFETDNHDTYLFSGVYTFDTGVIHLQIFDAGFPLDETTTASTSHLGLLYAFTTAQMTCGAIGHGYDEQISVGIRHYQCPRISQGAGSDVENAFELGAVGLGGSVFRQRDTYPTGSIDPLIRRGYGVYRRVGDEIYAYFGQSFDDFNLLIGTLVNGELQLQFNDLGAAGICDRT